MENILPKLPLAKWVDTFVEGLTDKFDDFFDSISEGLEAVVEGMTNGLLTIPSIVFIIVLALIAWKLCRWPIAIFTLVGLFLIDNLGYWEEMINTLSLVVSAVVISIVLGIPIGIWASQSKVVRQIIIPILDFMQTMPAFVYLVPAIMFFNIGVVPGIFASVIFSMPPTIRLTILGIQQVPEDLIEATEAFGSTTKQRLLKVQLPLAMPTIMAGVNQSIMLALSMVVIAAMVGAPGLGTEVYRAVTQIKIGVGFEAGLAVVILAIILDRITQNIGKNKKKGRKCIMFKKLFSLTLVLALVLSLAACGSDSSSGDNSGDGEGDTASKKSVGEQVDYEIVGIDPGAGIMQATGKAIEEYGLEKWDLLESSGAAMTAELKSAYEDEEPIIVTGWTPHWMFAKFDLKYLEDPKGVYGGEENIHTMVRKGLETDLPNAYKILDQFNWTADQMGDVMVMIEDGMEPAEAAAKWVDENADQVATWTEGTEKVDGKEVKIAYVAWASAIASNNVLAEVLKNQGFDVTISQLEAGGMWAGVADGSVDALIAGWLPVTHKAYYDKFKNDVVDLGVNLEGTKIGLTVPTYMDIDSIEDLKE